MAGEVEGAAEGGAPEVPDIDSMSDAEFEEFKNAHKEGEEAPEPKAKEPEAGGDDDDDDSEPVAGSQSVPHAKFHRVNERRKEAEKRAEEAQRNATVAMQRMAELMEAMKGRQEPEQKAEPEEPEHPGPKPSAADSPYDWAIWREKKDAWDEYQASQQRAQVDQQQHAHRQWQEAYTSVLTQFETAKQAEPELQGLYDGLRTSYAREYQAYGYSMPQIAQLVERQEAQIIQWAHANRIPIGQTIKALAESRGVQAQAPEQGGAQVPRDPATGQFKSAQDIDKLDQTKRASRSLNGGAAVRTEGPTPEDIVNMSEEDFAAFKKEYGDKAMAKAFGVAA